MPITFTRPTVTDSGETSAWNEAGNPIVYSWQYYDALINQVNNSGGFAQLQVTGMDVTSAFNIGNEIYIGIDGYEDIFEITNVAFSGGNTLITTDAPYNGTGTGYAYDLGNVGSFIVDVDLYNAVNDKQIGVTLTSVAGNPGLIEIDVSAIIKAYLTPDLNIDLTGSTETFDDVDGYLITYIIYTTTIGGVPDTPVDDSSNPIYSAIGALQIPSEYGGNLFEYVTFADGGPKGKFLTRLTEPKAWRGFPILVSIIVGDLGAISVLNVVYKDEDGDVISTSNSDNIAATEGALYIFELNNILAVPDSAVTATVALYSLTGPTLLSEELTFEIVDACKNPVMLLGRNSLGGVMQWLFEVSQEEDFSYSDDIKRKRNVLSVAGLTKNEWDSLQDFITLGEVYRNNITRFTSETIKTHSRIGSQVYVLDEDGNKIGVVVIPNRNRTFTKLSQHYFEIEIEYPEQFVP